jgi:hypothetical protein
LPEADGFVPSTGAPMSREFSLKPARDHAEDNLQESLVVFFGMAVRPGDALLVAIPNGGLRDLGTAKRLSGGALDDRAPDDAFLVARGQGVLPGATDLIIITDLGKVWFVEVKRPALPKMGGFKARAAGVLSRAQKLFRNALVRLKHNHRVVYSVEDFKAILTEAEVPMRAVRFS